MHVPRLRRPPCPSLKCRVGNKAAAAMKSLHRLRPPCRGRARRGFGVVVLRSGRLRAGRLRGGQLRAGPLRGRFASRTSPPPTPQPPRPPRSPPYARLPLSPPRALPKAVSRRLSAARIICARYARLGAPPTSLSPSATLSIYHNATLNYRRPGARCPSFGNYETLVSRSARPRPPIIGIMSK